jgi:putative SOS response-associated peptidase YedK
MCGRYYRVEDKQAIAEYFRSNPADDELLPPGFNIAPTTRQPVIRQGRDTGGRELVGMRWGLVGFGTKGMDRNRATFNARCENLTTSGLWRNPLQKRRCLVPLSGFYEWRKSDKAAFRFTLSDQPMYALAGLWDAWKNPDTGEWLQSFSAITVEASPAMQGIHDRMPAILSPRDYDEWLDRGEIERPPVHLLRPYYAPPAGPHLKITPANPKVGNVRNQDISMLDSQ